MTLYHIINDHLMLTVAAEGAELRSVLEHGTMREYLWSGHPDFWGRRSPILFPFVGSLKNKSYTYEDTVYPMSQHGFARDMTFERLEHSETSIWFRLKSNEATYAKYPFHFSLRVGYELIDRKVIVRWEVENTDKKEMHFSIGAHPAFLRPMDEDFYPKNCYLSFDDSKKALLRNRISKRNGLLEEENIPLSLQDGYLLLDEDLFEQDALIFEGGQAHKVSLLDHKKEPMVTVSFDAPLFGVWAPNLPNVPFVCIEPWYGRCDSTDFDGSLAERAYTNTLEPGGTFRAQYEIEFHQ